MSSRRLEDRIHELCEKAVASANDEEMLATIEELRRALHSHTERIRVVARGRLTAGLPVLERRSRKTQQSAGKEETPG